MQEKCSPQVARKSAQKKKQRKKKTKSGTETRDHEHFHSGSPGGFITGNAIVSVHLCLSGNAYCNMDAVRKVESFVYIQTGNLNMIYGVSNSGGKNFSNVRMKIDRQTDRQVGMQADI